MEENSTLLLNEGNIESTFIIKTPKSQKQNDTDVRRWASVVKAHNTILHSSPEVNRFMSGKDEALEMFDCLPDIISENYENQKGFITFNKNSFFCEICSLDLDTMISLTNHLKTRKHEDNVIVFLKNKLPAHLEHMMEFVSFCKSDLCCNLCQETINMCLNPHQTLLNIIAHNTDVTHANLRASHDEHSLAHNLLNTLSETHPEIMDNLHFVDKKIIPQFKCKLCSKNIIYNEHVDLLEKHFISHFKSLGHVKNLKAIEALKLFDEVSITGKEKFVVKNGNILCTVCNDPIETDVEKLILHVKGVEHTSQQCLTHSLAELKLSSVLDVKIENNGGEKSEVSAKKSFVFETEEIKKKKLVSEEKVNPDTKLNRLISTLPSDLRQIDYLIENDKGSVTCLICNCVVPPCKNNLLNHLKGNHHQRKVESKKVSKLEDTKNQSTGQTESREPSHTLYSKFSLKSMPEKLGNINYIITNNTGGLECLVCKCDLPLVSSTIEEHLRSLAHKKMENRWFKKCPRCPCSNSSGRFFKDILKIPQELRVYQCKSVNATGPASIYDDYSLLLKKHTIISKSKDLLIINVDGKNCYCKLCKSLIPLTSNVNDLEKNLVSHLFGKTHMLSSIKNLGKKLEEVKKSPHSSSTGKVARSLFVFSNGDEKKMVDTKTIVCEGLSQCDEQNTNIFTTFSVKRKLSGAAVVSTVFMITLNCFLQTKIVI